MSEAQARTMSEECEEEYEGLQPETSANESTPCSEYVCECKDALKTIEEKLDSINEDIINELNQRSAQQKKELDSLAEDLNDFKIETFDKFMELRNELNKMKQTQSKPKDRTIPSRWSVVLPVVSSCILFMFISYL